MKGEIFGQLLPIFDFENYDAIKKIISTYEKPLALLRTGCVYYEYEQRKIRHLPESFIQAFLKK